MYTEKPFRWSVTTALGSTILIPPGRMRRSDLWWSGSSQGHTASAWGRGHDKVTPGGRLCHLELTYPPSALW